MLNFRHQLITVILCGLFIFLIALQAEAITLGVPAFSQNNNTWSGDQLGTCSGLTIGSDGCALTSKAMVFNYFSLNYTDPGQLNTCLTNNGGYSSGCYMNFDNTCVPLFGKVEIF